MYFTRYEYFDSSEEEIFETIPRSEIISPIAWNRARETFS